MIDGKATRCTEGLIERIQVIDEGVDRTPKPMPGVKTHAAALSVTEDSKGSVSANSDAAFDRMSFLSFDAGTAIESVDLSPSSCVETSRKAPNKNIATDSEKQDSSGKTSVVSTLEVDDETKSAVTDMEQVVNIVLYSSDVTWLLSSPGTSIDKENEEALQAKKENLEYEKLLKSKQEAPEKYMENETQTLNKLMKNQETQSISTAKRQQSVQVTSWDIYDSYCQQNAEISQSKENVLTDLKKNVVETADSNANQQSMYLQERRESMSDGRSLIDRASSISGFSYTRNSRRESMISTISVPASTGGDKVLAGALEITQESLVEAETEGRGKNVFTEMPDLMDALHLMDCLTTQKQYTEKLLAYKGIQFNRSKKALEESSEKSETGSLANRKLSFALSSRLSMMLQSSTKRSGLKSSESVSNADDDQETMSVATDLEGGAENTRPKTEYLWQWKCTETENKTVACIAWKPDGHNLLAVGYGDLKFTPKRVTALAFSIWNPFLLAVGMHDGTIALYDIHKKSGKEIMHSRASDGRHTEPVWQLEWKQEGDNEQKLVSVSGDGRVTCWSISKGLDHIDLIKLKRIPRKRSGITEENKTPFISRISTGLCMALHPTDPTLYLVGTDDGWVHKCSTSYSEQYLDSFQAHLGSVYSVSWSPFKEDLFLSCGSDWTVCLWLADRTVPILTFNTNQDEISDMKWAPFHSTVFACVTNGGKLEVWDIGISTVKPIAYHLLAGCKFTNRRRSMWSSSDEDDGVVIKKRRMSPSRRFQSLQKRRENTQTHTQYSVVTDQLHGSVVVNPVDKPKTALLESMLYWKEFCSTEVFRNVCSSLKGFNGSLPKILLSKDVVFQTLLSALNAEAELSLQAIMGLITGFSRDLQNTFIDYLPELVLKIGELCSDLKLSPEVVGHVLTALAKILKQLKKHLISLMSEFLTRTMQPLILHSLKFVREVTSRVLAGIVRQLSTKKLKLVLAQFLGCICKRRETNNELIDAFSCVVSHICMNVQHTLHSKCNEVLDLLFQGNLLHCGNFHTHEGQSAPEWLTEDLIQERLFTWVRCIFNDYLLKYTDKSSTEYLWQLVFKTMKEKLRRVKSVLESQSFTEGRMLLKDVSCLLSIASKILSTFNESLICDVDLLQSCLDLFQEEEFLDLLRIHEGSLLETGRLLDDNEISICSLPGQISIFMISTFSSLDKIEVEEQTSPINDALSTLFVYLPHLSSAEMLFVAKKAVRNDLYLSSLLKPLLENFCAELNAISQTYYQESFVLIWQMVSSSQDLLTNVELIPVMDSFLSWLERSVNNWPGTELPNSLSFHRVVRTGILTIKCLAKLCAKRPELLIENCKKLLTQVSLVEVVEDLEKKEQMEELRSVALCEIRIILAQTEMDLAKQKIVRSHTSELVNHLKSALERLKSIRMVRPSLKCVNLLLKILKSETGSQMESIFSEEEIKDMVCRFELCLRSKSKQTRCYVLEILSMFGFQFSESCPHLFHALLEIEQGDFSGLDRRVEHKIEMIQKQIKYEDTNAVLLPSCFSSFLGLLNIPYQPIWPTVSETISILLKNQFTKFWPILFLEMMDSQCRLLMGNKEEIEETKSQWESFFLKKFDMECAIMYKPESSTDDLTTLLQYLQSIESIGTDLLASKTSDWLPLSLQWMEHRVPIKTQNQRHKLTRGEWLKGMKAWLTVLSILDSFEDQESIMNHLISLLEEVELQKSALELLSKFDIKWMTPVMGNLLNMTETKGRSSEILNFHLDVKHLRIDVQYRSNVVGIIIKILYPHIKITKSKKQKGDPILTYLSSAESHELVDLIELLFGPWDAVFLQSETRESNNGSLVKHKWWASYLMSPSISTWLEMIDQEALKQSLLSNLLQTSKQNESRKDLHLLLFLVDCLVFNLGHKIIPYLPFVLSLLASVLLCIQKSEKDLKESMEDSLHLLSSIFTRFPTNFDYLPLLEILIPSLLEYKETMLSESKSGGVPAFLNLVRSIIGLPCFGSLMCLENACHSSFQSLVEHTLQLMSNPSINQASYDAILELIECLLDCDGHTNEQIINCILQGLQAHFYQTPSTKVSTFLFWNSSQSIGCFQISSKRELAVLERILDLNPSQDTIQTLVSTLVRIVHTKDVSQLIKCLDCLASIWTSTKTTSSTNHQVFSEVDLRQFSTTLAKKASKVESTDARLSLSSAMNALAKWIPSLAKSAKIFTQLVSFVPNQLEGVDYESRLKAYEKLTVEFWNQECYEDVEILVHACLFDLSNGLDYSLRQAASAALYRLIESHSSHQQSAPQSLFNQLTQRLRSSNLAIRQECLLLMSKLMELDEGVRFPWAPLLYHSDEELDFFKNVAHFQVSKRIRCWQRLLKRLESQDQIPMSNGQIMESSTAVLKSAKILTPILFQTIFDGQSSEKRSKQHKATKVNLGKESSLVETCVKVLAKLAMVMPWVSYRKLLNQILSRMKTKEQISKGMIRALCTVVDSFHFSPSSTNNGQEMEVIISERIIPYLQHFLINETGEKASLPVAVSLAKLLSRSPWGSKSDLQGLLMKLSGLMLHRVQHLRDEARTVFISVAQSLGSGHLQSCVSSLMSALPMKGYSAHVLDFTLNSLIEKITQEELDASEIDGIVESVLSVISTSLFGDPAEERSAQQFATKYKEAKSSKAPNTFQLLCRFSSFDHSFTRFLAFFQEKLSLCGSVKIRKIIENLLDQAVHGFAKNPTCTMEEKLNRIKVLLMHQEQDSNKYRTVANSFPNLEEMESAVNEQRHENLTKHSYLIVEFGLRLLRKCMKEFTPGANPEPLDAFIAPLIECLKSDHGTISSLALKSLCVLISYPLPSFQSFAFEAGRAVICLLDASPNLTTDSIAQDCLKLLARMLQAGDWFKPTTLQVNSLLTLIHSDFEDHGGGDFQSSFKLLRAIIDRKILVPRVYDLMTKVREMMIRTHSSQVREMGASLYFQFLIKFPHPNVQLEQHLLFILTNLEYEYEAGRLQALELVNQVLLKFPVEFLVEKSSLFYLPLVRRLSQESSSSIKEQVVSVMKTLLRKLNQKTVRSFIEMNLEWIKGTTSTDQLPLMGFQAMGVIMDCFPGVVKEEFNDEIYHILQQNLTPELEWKELYLTLHLMEKLCQIHQQQVDSPEESLLTQSCISTGVLWTKVLELINYPHSWIRASVCRLIGHAFAVLEGQIRDLMDCQEGMILGQRTAPQLTFSCYVILESDTVDEKTAKQCSRNLVWLAPVLHVQSSVAPRKDQKQSDRKSSQDSALSLMGLISRMTKLADLRSVEKSMIRISAFKFLGALAIRLQNFSSLETYLGLMLKPIYRIMENKDVRDCELKAKEIAQEVLEHIKSLIQGQVFREAYFEAKTAVEEARKERKAKESVQKVLNQQSFTKRKLNQHRKKQEVKKQRKWKLN
eukprot:g1373.t1